MTKDEATERIRSLLEAASRGLEEVKELSREHSLGVDMRCGEFEFLFYPGDARLELEDRSVWNSSSDCWVDSGCTI